jgi:hypothetical protein
MNSNCNHVYNGSLLTHINGVGWGERFCKYCGYTEKLEFNEDGPTWREKVTPPEFIEAIRIIIEAEPIPIGIDQWW